MKIAAIVGDASIADAYGDDYYVKVVQNPFVEETDIFEGMMAVSTYTSSEKRSLEIVQAFQQRFAGQNLSGHGGGVQNQNRASPDRSP